MKTLRKSLYRDTHRLQISTPLPLSNGPQSASLPPQKVIRAIASCDPIAPDQLPFQKGDFFYVTADPGPDNPSYHVHNPVTGARGLVPKHLLKSSSRVPPRDTRPSHPLHSPIPPSPNTPKSRVFYAVVLHDFLAERADELDAKAGDPISVVAQSNREWFVAKPIGRLGRPGLIPASFVELRDPASNLPVDDVDALMDRGDLPKVEDWKKAMVNYKQNSISLGVIDDTQSSVPNSPFSQTNAPPLPPHSASPPPVSTPAPRPPSPVPLPDGILLSAEVVSFHHEMDEYWFRIDAIFQPYDPVDPHVLPSAKQLVLFRPYNDFYDFQVKLLQTFPQEAGREPGSTRILPFMPGPADTVDDSVTALRRIELDQYIRKLCDLNSVGASYILEHQLIRTFLALKPGDVENDIDPRYEEISALFSEGTDQDPAGVAHSNQITREFEQEVRDTLGEMKLTDRDERSDGSDYGDDYTPHPHPLSNSSGTAHHRSDTLASVSQIANGPTIQPRRHRHYTRHNHPSHPAHVRIPRSATNLNAPPMSTGNPQIAFVKIKIFDRVTDDLIAIRVHPKVTHSELMSKVQARLGTNISNLRYRNSLHHEFKGLQGDHDLRDWIESTEKHVLYAD
ncbi:hypothetical protein JVT61DRAFT_13160 [Boletus reticuloceps]|uniref:Uncharacterized protein n=1 Tax=Boletus reticuloceps TaxID=495285 RepID=A0A8I2YT90_9AGAM|nr:hypothetical protein JVT61DRAFT_13160 [Boletus reticuloceps]